ncbi:MAG: histidinol phosphate phosphatase [Clostridium sp.]|uniref:histidinol phosphate phosphatase n=1 Tax=Clostridium sp. TaxID=1506 RepID=UPI0030272C41
MIFDSHIHTSFSTDSTMKLKDAISVAKDHNIGLVITDHMDLNYPEDVGFKFNVDEYFSTYEDFKGDDLLLGIELGMSLDFKDENKTLIEAYNFDQVIGSVHTINNLDIGYPEVYKDLSYGKVLENYFKEIVSCIESHPYIDTLGHIDYISRYAPVTDSEIYYNKYSDYIDEVLKACIKTNTAMEINTRRLKNKVGFDNLKIIYSRYKDLGGNYVTLGSDSHNTASIKSNFNEALLLCDLCGVKPVYFKNRVAFTK